MENKDKSIIEGISRKLNVLISLMMLNQNEREFKSDVEKISKLKEWGLENEEIGEMMGKTPTQISKQIYKSKIRSKKT